MPSSEVAQYSRQRRRPASPPAVLVAVCCSAKTTSHFPTSSRNSARTAPARGPEKCRRLYASRMCSVNAPPAAGRLTEACAEIQGCKREPATASGRNQSTVANHQRRELQASTRVRQQSVFARNHCSPESPFRETAVQGSRAPTNMRRTTNRNYSANNHPRERTDCRALERAGNIAAPVRTSPPRNDSGAHRKWNGRTGIEFPVDTQVPAPAASRWTSASGSGRRATSPPRHHDPDRAHLRAALRGSTPVITDAPQHLFDCMPASRSRSANRRSGQLGVIDHHGHPVRHRALQHPPRAPQARAPRTRRPAATLDAAPRHRSTPIMQQQRSADQESTGMPLECTETAMKVDRGSRSSSGRASLSQASRAAQLGHSADDRPVVRAGGRRPARRPVQPAAMLGTAQRSTARHHSSSLRTQFMTDVHTGTNEIDSFPTTQEDPRCANQSTQDFMEFMRARTPAGPSIDFPS